MLLNSCNKNEKDQEPKNDVISATINGPGLNNYAFKTEGILGKIFGVSFEFNNVVTVSVLVQMDITQQTGIAFSTDSPGTYPLVESDFFSFSNPDASTAIIEFTQNGILYSLFAVNGSVVVNNVDVTPIEGGQGAGLASGNGTFSGTFVTYDDEGKVLGTYQVTNGVFKFSKGQ